MRRFKTGGHPEREALVMRHARAYGYPVPDILEVTTDALVLEKVEGPTMWEAAGAAPSAVPGHAAALAQLHVRLHELAAPEGLAAVGPGDRLLHLDLHPANVILSPDGPVVIDWTNARRGEPAFDVALSWVIGATSVGLGPVGHSFTGHFLSHFDRGELLGVLRAAAAYRLADANVTDEERESIRKLVAEQGA